MRDEFDFIPTSPASTERWDREWLQYLATENPAPHLLDARRLRPRTDIGKLGPEEVYDTSLVPGLPPARIWIAGQHIVGKRVLEIGCGTGVLGKQLGLLTARYLGVDHSRFAISIARLTSPPECTYLHASEGPCLSKYRGEMDTMVARFFFIHQNLASARWVLRAASLLLRTGGLVSADFWRTNADLEHGIVHPAAAPLDPAHPSCAFEFTPDQIDALARETGFEVRSSVDRADQQRRFVLLEKTASLSQSAERPAARRGDGHLSPTMTTLFDASGRVARRAARFLRRATNAVRGR
jgi:SAM-dependent methyltransferase